MEVIIPFLVLGLLLCAVYALISHRRKEIAAWERHQADLESTELDNVRATGKNNYFASLPPNIN